MDDPKKPKMDPIFEELLKGFSSGPLRPDPGRPKPERRRYDPFGDLFLPVPTLELPPLRFPTISPREMVAKMMDDLQMMMGPPTPLSEPEEKLYSLAVEMGYRVVQDTVFGVDHDKKKLMTDMHCNLPMRRLLAISHEVGHMRRVERGVLDKSKFVQWRTSNPQVAEAGLKRYILAEEILAWREGMQVLRSLKVKFNSLKGVREFRATCLATYRFTTGLHGAAFRRLSLKEG